MRPLKHVAEVMFSNVDKKSVDGQIPVRLCNYTDVYYNDVITAEMEFMEATATDVQVAAFSLQSGDVLLTKDSETADDIGVSAYVVQDLPGVLCGYHLAIARPRSGMDGKFLRWALAASTARGQLEVAATGVTRFGLRQDAVARMTVTVPGLAAQRMIADYLDRETARIDRLIELRRHSADALNELRLAVLDDAFGSTSNGTWRLKHLLAQPPCYGVLVPHFADDGVPMVRVGDIEALARGVTPAVSIEPRQADEYNRTTLRAGDVVLSVVGSVDKVAVVPVGLEGANVARAVCRLVPRAGVPSELLALWFSTSAYLSQALAATGADSAQPTLGMGDLANFAVRFPPLEQTRTFRARLEERLGQITALRVASSRHMDLLLERRQALITEAVTGQLEIPGFAA